MKIKRLFKAIAKLTASAILLAICPQNFNNWQSAVYFCVMYAGVTFLADFFTGLVREIKDTNDALDRAHRAAKKWDWKVG